MRLSRAAARRLGLTAALAPFYYVVVGAVATLLGPKGYSSTAQTMSELAEPGAPRPHFISAAFMGYATLVQGLGPLLHREAGGGWRGRTLWGLVGVYGLGGFLAGVFREGSERGGPSRSRRGRRPRGRRPVQLRRHPSRCRSSRPSSFARSPDGRAGDASPTRCSPRRAPSPFPSRPTLGRESAVCCSAASSRRRWRGSSRPRSSSGVLPSPFPQAVPPSLTPPPLTRPLRNFKLLRGELAIGSW